MRVAVVGTGISGNAAAWTLSKHYPVIVYDRELRPGGHSHTVRIDYDGTQLAVDIGRQFVLRIHRAQSFVHVGRRRPLLILHQ